MAKKVHVELVALESLKVWRSQLKSLVDTCGGVMPFANTLVGAFPEFGHVCGNVSLLRRWHDLMSGYVSPGYHEAVVVMGLYAFLYQDDESPVRLFAGLEDGMGKFVSSAGK